MTVLFSTIVVLVGIIGLIIIRPIESAYKNFTANS